MDKFVKIYSLLIALFCSKVQRSFSSAVSNIAIHTFFQHELQNINHALFCSHMQWSHFLIILRQNITVGVVHQYLNSSIMKNEEYVTINNVIILGLLTYYIHLLKQGAEEFFPCGFYDCSQHPLPVGDLQHPHDCV